MSKYFLDKLLDFLQLQRLDLSEFDKSTFIESVENDVFPCPLEHGAKCLDFEPRIESDYLMLTTECLDCLFYRANTSSCDKGHDFERYKYLINRCLFLTKTNNVKFPPEGGFF